MLLVGAKHAGAFFWSDFLSRNGNRNRAHFRSVGLIILRYGTGIVRKDNILVSNSHLGCSQLLKHMAANTSTVPQNNVLLLCLWLLAAPPPFLGVEIFL